MHDFIWDLNILFSSSSSILSPTTYESEFIRKSYKLNTIVKYAVE